MIELAIFVSFCAVLLFVYRFKRFESLVAHIPGPPTLPIIGNGLLFIGKSPEDILKTTVKIHEDYGNIFRCFVGPKIAIVLCDPKDVEFVLSSHELLEKADEYDPIAEWLGLGLLISSGRKWFSRRKIITPAFHFKILEEFVGVFDKHSEIFVENLKQFEGQEVDVFPLVTLLTLDVICETSMGVEIHAQTNSNSEYVKAVQEITNIITTRHYNFLLRSNLLFKLSPLYQRQRKVLKILHGFTDSVIVSRREELIRNKPATTTKVENEDGTKKKMALLDILLQSTIDGQPLTNTDIREEVDTFMFEGRVIV
jgi:cytochrome P450 family 4